MTRAKGTLKYTERFKGLPDTESKTLQAVKSLQMHKQKSQPYTRQTHRMLVQDYLTKADDLETTLPPNTVFVEHGGQMFSMPRIYAEHLEGLGKVKILKSKADIQHSKPKRGK